MHNSSLYRNDDDDDDDGVLGYFSEKWENGIKVDATAAAVA